MLIVKIQFQTYPIFHQRHFGALHRQLQGKLSVVPPNYPKKQASQRQLYRPFLSPNTGAKKGATSRLKTLASWFLNIIIGTSIVVGMFIAIPALYYSFTPADTQPVKTYQEGTPLGGDFSQGPVVTPEASSSSRVVPPQDPSLPEGEWLIIPKIGVRTQPQATLSPEKALETGVWQVPEFGVAGDTTKPMILAAHRFGWQWWWQTDYWKYHSFYLLPDLLPGDIVEVISDQRKYYYEIYAGEEGEEISDYQADMILYTCKYLSSPRRHFRYARLIDPTQDTQVSNSTPEVGDGG